MIGEATFFVPFRGGGLPGVTLSEQGNAGWKRHMMSLVRAAKEDFAIMVLQERHIQMSWSWFEHVHVCGVFKF